MHMHQSSQQLRRAAQESMQRASSRLHPASKGIAALVRTVALHAGPGAHRITNATVRIHGPLYSFTARVSGTPVGGGSSWTLLGARRCGPDVEARLLARHGAPALGSTRAVERAHKCWVRYCDGAPATANPWPQNTSQTCCKLPLGEHNVRRTDVARAMPWPDVTTWAGRCRTPSSA